MPHPSVPGGRVRRLVALAAVALLPVAAGCTASYGAETQRPYDPSLGANADAGDNDELKIRGALVVADGAGRGVLVGTIVNSGADDDTLVGLSVEEGSAQLEPSQIDLEPGAPTRFGSDDVDAPTVAVDGPALEPGRVVEVTLQFGAAAPTTMNLQVVRNVEAYEDVTIPDPADEPAHTPVD